MIANRRNLLVGGLALVGAATSANAQMQPQTSGSADKNLPDLTSAMQFYVAVLGPAEVSLATSQFASQMATTRDALEFAGFELAEAITVNNVLKNLGAKSPPLDADGKAAIQKVRDSGKLAALDRSYIAFQLANHEHLRGVAEAYLHNTLAASDPAEIQGRSLAALMLGVFKEHTIICKRISTEIKAL